MSNNTLFDRQLLAIHRLITNVDPTINLSPEVSPTDDPDLVSIGGLVFYTGLGCLLPVGKEVDGAILPFDNQTYPGVAALYRVEKFLLEKIQQQKQSGLVSCSQDPLNTFVETLGQFKSKVLSDRPLLLEIAALRDREPIDCCDIPLKTSKRQLDIELTALLESIDAINKSLGVPYKPE